MSTPERNTAWLKIVLVALAPFAALALAASFAWSVDAMAAGEPWRLLGLAPRACPGCAACGLSRAFTALSHGDVARAVAFNVSVVVLYPLAWIVALAGIATPARHLLQRRSPCRTLPS